MSQVKRSRFSAAQKTDIWRRWKTGQSLHEIGRVYTASGITQFLFLCGGTHVKRPLQ